MGLDIRWPIGLMFTLIGVLLTGYGAVKPLRLKLGSASTSISSGASCC